MKIRLKDGSIVEFDEEPIFNICEIVVFSSKDKQSVVTFYTKDSRNGEEQWLRYNLLVKHNPMLGDHGDYWRNHYCWPTGIIDGSAHSISTDFLSRHNLIAPGLGVVSPTYGPNFHFRDIRGKVHDKNVIWFTGPVASKLVPEEEMGTIQTRVKACAKIARAIRKMHSAGLAHSDLSNKSVLIDLRNGDACLLVNDPYLIIIPKVVPPAIIGTPGYLAPENVSGVQTSINTNLHSLAVLIYEILLQRHPLRGKLIHDDAPLEDEFLMMGKRALFIEHPTDKSNAPNKLPEIPMTALGPYLTQLFLIAFVDGLHHPKKRPTAAEWECALYKTFDLLHPTPDGANWFVLAPGMPTRCPYTAQKLTRPVPFAYLYVEGKNSTFVQDPDGRTLTIFENCPLMKWHTHANQWPDENADPQRQGYFSFHKEKWYLQNESGSPMQVVKGPSVPNGTPIEITRGLQLMVGEAPNRRILVFDFLQPC